MCFDKKLLKNPVKSVLKHAIGDCQASVGHQCPTGWNGG